MTIEEIKNLVQGEVVCGEDYLDSRIECVFASDLMSDVLTLKDVNNLLLLTGLSNLQSIRTCEMSDINYMLIVRGKEVTEEMKELADQYSVLRSDILSAIDCVKNSGYAAAGIVVNMNTELFFIGEDLYPVLHRMESALTDVET